MEDNNGIFEADDNFEKTSDNPIVGDEKDQLFAEIFERVNREALALGLTNPQRFSDRAVIYLTNLTEYHRLIQSRGQIIDLLRNTTNHLNSAKFLATTKKIS